MTDVLIVGESWVSVSTHYKGFNHFVSGTYETGLRWFSKALERHGLDVTHMPSHVAANDFPFTPDGYHIDVDKAVPHAQLVWSGASYPWGNPTGFGTLLLGP